MTKSLLFLFGLFFSVVAISQTTIIQTLTYDSSGRDYVFQFPTDTTSYEKIIMEYSMRCKNGLVSTQGAPNDIGCGEWDYSCNTFIQDSGKTDSMQAVHPSYFISNFAKNNFPYTTTPTYTYYSYQQYKVNYDSTLSEDTALIGHGNDTLTYPFATENKISKSQYLWTKEELSANGLSAGDITGIRLKILQANDTLHFLRIRIKATTQTKLTAQTPETNGFTEVYFANTVLTSDTNQFNFYKNFSWDGTSNLLVEFSFTNPRQGNSSTIEGAHTDSCMALINNGHDYFLSFAATGHVDISHTDYSSVKNEISVMFWAYGNPDILPVKTSAFEATDLSNRRQVHSHLPWSNSNIYWDCGNTGSYDRIYKAASQDEIAGQWHHWTFVKNAPAGEMKIYLDGELWHSGTGKTHPISIHSFYFGASISGSYSYYGNMDDFSVWDKALSQTEIQNCMYTPISSSHPEYSHLLNYFMLNTETGYSIIDSSQHHIDGHYKGTLSRQSYRGIELFKDFTESAFRPNIAFLQGSYQTHTDTITVLDSVKNSPNTVIAYQVNGTDLETIDTSYYYLSGYMPVYDESHTKIDSFFVSAEDTLHITTLHYFRKFPSSFEIMSFVTPYGLHLDLGPDGKTWQFDVTDFAPILRGRKRLYLTGGTHQEDLDIRFIFKKGTPPRKVIDIQQIWRAGVQHNYTDIIANKYFEPRHIALNPEASTFKIRTAITGHGQEGEFIARTHFLNLNNGAKRFQWQVWKGCADNPIYPQGGTWIYDRAGWCPGAPTNLTEFEVTDYISGNSLDVDYGITSASGDSRYLVNCQLVSYGAPNFNNDVAIDHIERPSQRIEFSRVNPVCYHPTVVIRNTGKTDLTSCKIEYYVTGSYKKTYNWTGNLRFNETETVALPIESPSFWIGDSSFTFFATVSEPNGTTDEYSSNNTDSSQFTLPDMYDAPLLIYLRTNNYAYENSYVVKDHEGNVVYSHSGLSNNTLYKDTLDLPNGCYTLEMYDSGNDGLSFWANSAQGSGYMYLKDLQTHQTYKNFQADFGKFFSYSFIMGDVSYLNKSELQPTDIEIYPNPTNGNVNIEVNSPNTANIKITIYDLTGREIAEKSFLNARTITTKFDLSEYENGMYISRIMVNNQLSVRKISLVR